MGKSFSESYKEAGVDITAGYKSVELTYRISDGKMVKMVLEEAIGVINTYEIK